MTDAITAGSILVEEGTHLPNSLLLQREAFSSGWAAVQGAHGAFETLIREAGMTFFFMAGQIKATVFGFDKGRSLRAALKQLIANVESQHCNAIEVTGIVGKSFLKVPYVTVTAHPRHLQKGLAFSGRL